jgi:hypothetical protein
MHSMLPTGFNWPAGIEGKALQDRDVAAGVLMVKIAEGRATLLGLNPPTGAMVAIVQHPPSETMTSTDKIRAAFDRIRGKRLSPPDSTDGSPPTQPH